VTVAPVPVPVSDTVWGLPGALSVTESEAVSVPAAMGVKVTLTVQLAPAATVLPQVLVWPKSPASAPVSPMLVIEARRCRITGRRWLGWVATLLLVVALGRAQGSRGVPAAEPGQSSAPAPSDLVREGTVVFSGPPPSVVTTGTKCGLNGDMYLVYSDAAPSVMPNGDAVTAFPIRKISAEN
jgi:hypothetical protein